MCLCPWYLCTPHNLRYQTVSNMITESMVQLSLSSPAIAHGLGETYKNDGRLGAPISLVGYATPQPGSSQSPKPNPETLTVPHTVFDV